MGFVLYLALVGDKRPGAVKRASTTVDATAVDATAVDATLTDAYGGYLEGCARDYAARAGISLPGKLAVSRPEPGGKPFFENAPGVHFSISHTGGLWGCAMGPAEVGFDVEWNRPRDYMGVARRFFHPQERENVEARGLSAFLQVWTAKESYVKYLGSGITDDFSHFSVIPGLAGEAGELNAVFTCPAVGRDYTACLCTGEAAQVELIWISKSKEKRLDL